MAKPLQEWVEGEVTKVKNESIRWLSGFYFFRDPVRPIYCNSSYFFSPADGIILYQKIVDPDERIIDIKGKYYTLKDAMQDSSYNQRSVVIGIFMTFYNVHINRVPLSGFLSYKHLDQICTYNYPMLDVEKHLVEKLTVNMKRADYLFYNQRVVNRIYSPVIGQFYYVLQVADYDVNTILPFAVKQNQSFHQNQRFSVVRYGSQVDLIIPLSNVYDFVIVQKDKMFVEAGLDPLIRIKRKEGLC